MMHNESLVLMEAMLARYGDGSARVLDVGSLDVNGTYRPLVESRGWSYLGLDIVDGPNVDVVSEDPLRYPFDGGEFDVVISGSTMEHVASVWLWVPELVRLLRVGGLLAICTVTSWPIHRYPVDCWRVLPDGMEHLFDLAGLLERYEIDADGHGNCYGSAFKCQARPLVKLDLGGALNCPAGYVAVDRAGGDVTVDLEDGALPFDDGSVEEIRAHHILEHITALIPLMNECHRVLRPGGAMCIEVPRYPSFTCFVDPTHVRVFTDVTFEYFTRQLAYFNYGILPWVIEEKETTPDYLRVRMRPDV